MFYSQSLLTGYPEVRPISFCIAVSQAQSQILSSPDPSTELWPMKYEWKFAEKVEGASWKTFILTGQPPPPFIVPQMWMWFLELQQQSCNQEGKKKNKRIILILVLMFWAVGPPVQLPTGGLIIRMNPCQVAINSNSLTCSWRQYFYGPTIFLWYILVLQKVQIMCHLGNTST